MLGEWGSPAIVWWYVATTRFTVHQLPANCSGCRWWFRKGGALLAGFCGVAGPTRTVQHVRPRPVIRNEPCSGRWVWGQGGGGQGWWWG